MDNTMVKMICVLFFSCLLAFVSIGCEKDKDEPKEEIKQEQQMEQEVNKEVLREEYIAIMKLMDEVLFSVSDEEMNFKTGVEALMYIRNNRIEPTQPQTIELDNKLDELINLGIEYFMTSNPDKQAEIRDEITETLDDIQEIMIEIEQLLAEYDLI